MDTQNPMLLWDLPPEDHAAFVAAGCGTESMEQYQYMLQSEQAYARSIGQVAVMLRLTVKQVLAELATMGMACSPAGVGLALRSIFERQMHEGLGMGDKMG